MSADEAAEYMGVSHNFVIRMALRGRVPGAFKPAGRWLFRRDLFEAWVDENTTKPAEA